MRYRDGYDKPLAWMEKGKVYKVTLQPLNTSNYFAAGHRLRIEVSSSNFPRFDRNLNTGGNNYDEAKGVVARNAVHHSKQHMAFKVARNSVHHSRKYPSRVTVTVVPRRRRCQAVGANLESSGLATSNGLRTRRPLWTNHRGAERPPPR